MGTVLQYITGFGLAAGAGGKACIPLLALGVFHRTPRFELSPQFAWVGSTPVLVVVAVIAAVELWADAHPDVGRLSDLAAALPKVVAGFILFAAATGTVDSSLTALVTSGVLGSVTAGGFHLARNVIRRPLRDGIEDIHHSTGKAITLGEAGLTAGVSVASVLAPVLALFLLGIGLVIGLGLTKKVGTPSRPCPACGKPVPVDAVMCVCGHELGLG